MILAALVLALAGSVLDDKVREVRDLPYVEGAEADANKHKLDLFLPVSRKPFPMLLWIHGGGWAMGDRSMYSALGRRFAADGVGCAVISYRLSPAVKHPEHVKDCARAFAWLAAHAKEQGGDPTRLFISGQSAGGHLSALLACDPRYLNDLKVPADALKGAIPMSGVYLIPARDVKMDNVFTKMFSQAFGTDPDACRDASPVTHLKECTVPMLVLTESDDAAIRLQMRLLKAAAEKEGKKEIEFADAADRNHISIVTQMFLPEDPVRARIVDFIKARCRALDAAK